VTETITTSSEVHCELPLRPQTFMPLATVFLKTKRTFSPAGVFALKADAGTPASEIVDLMVWMTFTPGVVEDAEVAGVGEVGEPEGAALA